jgi:hypothetical protein
MLFIFVTGSELLPSTSTFRYSLQLRHGAASWLRNVLAFGYAATSNFRGA